MASADDRPCRPRPSDPSAWPEHRNLPKASLPHGRTRMPTDHGSSVGLRLAKAASNNLIICQLP
eukprot:9339579-Alexandrium_andersonii.AAC.1